MEYSATRRARNLATSAAIALTLAACGSPAMSDQDETTAADPEALSVLASFYPLQFVAERIGGDSVTVANLTPASGEPHDLELSPAAIRELSVADLVVYQSGFQPAVDDAVTEVDPTHVLDVTPYADLEARDEDEHAEDDDHADEDDHDHAEGEDHDDHDHAGHDHDHGGIDPHFWLDPTRLAAVAEAVGTTLAEIDPDGADGYAARTAELVADLNDLDADLASGLATCESRVFVTSHESFGYLAERYDLEQIGISGLDPEAEPSPARLREVSELVEQKGVTTIFYESAASSKVSEVLASDLGVETGVLDPLETNTGEGDYLSTMQNNLTALRTALGCR